MQEKIAPVIIRKPSSPASQEIAKIASRFTGIKMPQMEEAKKVGFLERLFSFFKRKWGVENE